ncbi:MAG: hypothetical protein OHK0046_33750 [Anaerolineae bacterium]
METMNRFLNRMSNSIQQLFDPVDIAPLIVFRVAFGSLMLWEVWRYFHFNRIARYYVEPSFFFHYYGFEWVQPLPGQGMFVLFHVLGLLSVAIMLGAFYRIAVSLFWLCFTYIFLLDQAQYLNHFYLVTLVSFLMIFIPAHRALSIDAYLRPALRSQVVPSWSLWLLRGQMAVVYIFGGIAKINPDWLAGEPLRDWLGDRTDFPVIGALFTEEWMVFLFSYGGLLLDLFIVPLLLWRRTRIPALMLATAFHLANARLFNIGIFPWFAIATTLIFLPPHWFRPPFWRSTRHDNGLRKIKAAHPRWILAGIILYFAVQILLPLRHWLYPGDPSWTEEGHTLAWHMRLRQKDGSITLFASDPATGSTWPLPAWEYLSSRQYSQVQDNPEMILRFAHHLAETLNDQYPGIQIRAWSMMSLNSRAPQLLLDPTIDLAQAADTLLASDWILPLAQRPVPHPAIPTLLISRRYAHAVVVINIAERDFPLEALTIGAGEQALAGLDFGVMALKSGECLLAHTEDAPLQTIFLPCNETGTRLVIPGVLLENPLPVETGHTLMTCEKAVCVVTLEGDA